MVEIPKAIFDNSRPVFDLGRAPPNVDTYFKPLTPQEAKILELAYPDEASEAKRKIEKMLDGLPQPERKKALRRLILDAKRGISVLEKERAKKREILKRSERACEALSSEVETLYDGPLFMEKTEKSMFSDFRKSFATGHINYCTTKIEVELPAEDYEREVLRSAEIFMVTHDWAAAFEGARDLEEAPFRLPYEVCAFEFQISGHRVIALASDNEGQIVFTPVFETRLGWLLLDFVYSYGSGQWSGNGFCSDWSNFVGSQIRAICIALDADVAKEEVVREPHVGVVRRNSFAPLKSYHVVSLVRRARALPTGNHGGGRPKRLHFRRGHWRHFYAFKTWVKWCLVGNPDLGFIDKEYRL